jgi:hypothetical protein
VAVPNVVAINRENGHAHAAYLLSVPVAKHSASRPGPLRFFSAVERGLARRVGADQHYAKLIFKNPVHADWEVEYRRDQPYTLHELADCLTFVDMRGEPHFANVCGTSRHCLIFDKVRKAAYSEVREFKRLGKSRDEFQAWLEEIGWRLNGQFLNPLNFSDIRATAKSIAKWTWTRFDDERFRALQAHLSKIANAKRWAGHVAESATEPWKVLGVSRATYYRRKKSGQL